MWQRIWNECGWIARRCRNRFRTAVALSLAFKALNLIFLVPLAAGILRLCLSQWGRASVGNFELVAFFTSPTGLAALVLVGGVLLASLYLELAGLLRIVADDRVHWWEAFRSSRHFFPRLVRLGLWQLAIYLALATPFLAGIGLVHWWFWSGRDINGLIILKPPEFWWGAGCAAVLVALYGVVALSVFLRQLYSVPILVLEPGARVHSALRMSAERSRGRLRRSGAALVVWLILQSLLTTAVLGTLQFGLSAIVSRSGSSVTRLVLVTGTVLAIQVVAATAVSVLSNISFVGVVLSLYRPTAPPGVLPEKSALTTTAPARRAMSLGWGLAVGLIAGAVAVVAISLLWIRSIQVNDSLEITAHRAGASAAPENTVAALKQAIADRADWAEIDVQLTADQALVIMHDIDLARVGGGSRRVDQATLAEIQALDVGTPFGQAFAGERVPQLKDILVAASDHIRLNVELKPHSQRDGDVLTRRVLAELREAGMLDRCRLCSQSYESLQLAREIEPRLEVGYIVATSVGDPTKLEVNFLMVKSSLATRDFVDRAKLHDIAVHAWTVNDSALVAPLLDAGVANLITDDPAGMRLRLDEIRALATPQRLLLRAAQAIAR